MKLRIFTIKIPKIDSNHTCLAVTSLDSALKDGNYYLQGFLKQCKYIEKKVVRYITQDKEIFSGDSDKEQFFFFNERLKKFKNRGKIFHCKIFPYIYYLYTLDYKNALLTTLSISLLNPSLQVEKFSQEGKNSHTKRKSVAEKGKVSRQKKKSHAEINNVESNND